MSTPPTGEAVQLLGVGMISTFTLELLGIPAQPIMWAAIGSIFGMGLAQQTGPVKRIFVYIGASLLSALLGTNLSNTPWFANYAGWTANTCAALFAVGFHPALSWFVQNVPAGLNWFAGFVARRNAP